MSPCQFERSIHSCSEMPINVILKVFGTIKMPASICSYFWKGCTLLRYCWWGFSWRHERRLKRRQRLSEHCGHDYCMHNDSTRVPELIWPRLPAIFWTARAALINPGPVIRTSSSFAVFVATRHNYFGNLRTQTRFLHPRAFSDWFQSERVTIFLSFHWFSF